MINESEILLAVFGGAAFAALLFVCGYYKGPCDEMNSQKTEINVDPSGVTAVERVRVRGYLLWAVFTLAVGFLPPIGKLSYVCWSISVTTVALIVIGRRRRWL